MNNEIDNTMTADRIIAAIESTPCLSDADAARIIESLAATFNMTIDFSIAN